MILLSFNKTIKMKILALALFNKEEKEFKLLHVVYDLSQFYFFQRSTIKEYCLFGMRTLAERTNEFTKQSFDGEKDFKVSSMFYTWSSGKLVACAITDKEYPKSSIYLCLQQALNGQKVDDLFTSFQEPEKGDKLFKIEKQLSEVKDIMSDNITLVLQRGETLESLIEKSQDISKQSKLFSKQAKKMNACCKSW